MELPIVEELKAPDEWREAVLGKWGFSIAKNDAPMKAADLITELVEALEKARGTIVMMREEIPVGGFAGHQTEVDIDAALARARSKG